MLQLEITERVVAQQTDELNAILRELDAMGVTLSLDDFGTGYSSLLRLQTLPVSELKIDRAFVSRLAEGLAAVGIVRLDRRPGARAGHAGDRRGRGDRGRVAGCCASSAATARRAGTSRRRCRSSRATEWLLAPVGRPSARALEHGEPAPGCRRLAPS